ncbi:MAG: hypothetical protein ACLVJ6_14155 [Merdibacter sp.]
MKGGAHHGYAETDEKKKRGEALTDAQIHELIAAYVRHDIPDYQMSAF